jgi:hypothetical protein
MPLFKPYLHNSIVDEPTGKSRSATAAGVVPAEAKHIFAEVHVAPEGHKPHVCPAGHSESAVHAVPTIVGPVTFPVIQSKKPALAKLLIISSATISIHNFFINSLL